MKIRIFKNVVAPTPAYDHIFWSIGRSFGWNNSHRILKLPLYAIAKPAAAAAKKEQRPIVLYLVVLQVLYKIISPAANPAPTTLC